MSNNSLRYMILAGVFAVPFVLFTVSSSLFFPFITGKAFIFRAIVEIIFFAWLILAMRDESYRPKFSWLLVSVLAFLIIIGLADFFAENPYKAFWSNYERMEGFLSILHFAAFFMVVGSMMKTHEIWDKFFATNVFASAIMSVYSFFQLAGKIPINQGGVRVDGTLGNASYLGIYMVFNLFFALFLFFRFSKNWQRILLAIVATMDIFVLYHTATRGAVLGFLGGLFITFLFLIFKSEAGSKIRKVAIWLIVSTVIFVGVFFVVRNTSFVMKSPVLSRFATLSFSEIKTQGRYYVWPMALKGFTDRPVLGWGQEGFNFVFNKYYNPKMYNQEPWFDRAHNTYLDWLIAGGLLGLLAYLSVIFYLLFYTFKNSQFNRGEKAAMLGLVSAYLFNNLFVFDQIGSYIPFFAILAFAHFGSQSTTPIWWQKIGFKLRNIFSSEKKLPIFEALSVILLFVCFYFVVFLPWRQNRELLDILQLSNQGKVGTLDVYKKPLSNNGMGFSESLEHISQTAISFANRADVSDDLKKGLFDLLDNSFKKHLEKVPTDARYRLFYGIFLSRFGWYGRAAEQLQEGLKLSPQKQQIYFELTSNLLLDGKASEALKAAKIAYELEPSYEEAKIVYGLTSLAVGDISAFQEIMKDVPQSKIIFDDRYLSILLGLKKYQEIINVAQKRIELDPTNFQHHFTLTAAYLEAGRRGEAVATLEEMIKIQPSFKEQGEYYINQINAGQNP